jgi:hypothetical protein
LLEFFASCNSNKIGNNKSNEDYLEVLGRMDSQLTDHFPAKIFATNYSTYYAKKEKKNEVYLIHYAYNVSNNELKSVRRFAGSKSIAHYNAYDSCLLIINRNETKWDSLTADSNCYIDKFPVPQFKDVIHPQNSNYVKLNSNYVLYVIEANSKDYYKTYNLKPNERMPNDWRNGYSKGIAINEKEKAIIYWIAIW